MVEAGRGGAAARVVAVRIVLRADGVWQLLWRCDMVGQDDESWELFQLRRCIMRGDVAQLTSLALLSYTWSAVFWVMYAIDFLCLSAAELMVLNRMSYFAAGQDDSTRKRWAAGGGGCCAGQCR